MGEVVEVGSGITNLKPGDRVVVPFTISCGACFFCKNELWSLCENTNPNAAIAEQLFGHTTAGLFGYSHMTGGFAGGQAQYVRVPFADIGPMKIENGLSDEQVLFLGDIFPTGYMAAENCNIQPGDTVAVWGCGPVGQFAIKSAKMLGAERVIAIDRFPERLAMAERDAAADDTINYEDRPDVVDELKVMTGGRGPDSCIDAVGSEAHGTGPQYLYDRTMHALRVESDRPFALRQAITACRGGGTVSVPGVYGGFIDKMPMGAVMNKGLTIRTGQTHVPKYMAPLLQRITEGEIDPSFVITHRMTLDDAPQGYKMFRDKEDECIKIVLNPHAATP
jgi:threonine dehydrogenase-like Zn-dependent dehydrogenase